MSKLILCEGATDAIFLSYYMKKVAGWEFCRGSQPLKIKEQNITESVNWYKKDEDRLLICGVGGKDKFKSFFESRIKNAIIDANAFDAIAVITDRDDKEIEDIEKHIKSVFQPLLSDVHNLEWKSNVYMDSFGIKRELKFLLNIIPYDYQGALETVMLDAIAEDTYDANIVQKSSDFVEQMRKEANKYISSDRLELKAKLGVTWAIQYPEKIFKLMNEQIESVAWEKSEVLRKCFAQLEEI